MIVSQPKRVEEEKDWAGRIFERDDLSYKEKMDQFIAVREAAQEKAVCRGEESGEAVEQGGGELKAVRRALKQEEDRLRDERRKERERRRLIDPAWKERKREHQEALNALKKPIARRGGKRSRKQATLKAQYQAEWGERHRELRRRQQEDVRWRKEREELRGRQQEAGIRQAMVWIAILVIVDNCTRRCLGLPLFLMGAHVTAELVAEALKALLPKELEYLISDRGTHFTAEAMKALAKGLGFVRVPLARHRPQSNGIAERFIETLKTELAGKEWQTASELRELLEEFVGYYNERPHQGRELAGLSPNEYASRLLAVA